MHTDGHSFLSGHAVIGVTTIALERGLLHLEDASVIRFDTPAGTVGVVATHHRGRVSRVSFAGIPSFVLTQDLRVARGSRDLRVDVAFGGTYYAIVDGESAGVPVLPDFVPELRKLGLWVRDEVNSLIPVVHPELPQCRGICGTIFTGLPNTEDADLRSVTVFADGKIDRSPCGTAATAVMAVLDAIGLLAADRPFVHESIIGTSFLGTVDSHTTVGDPPAVVTPVEGSAFVTGEHEFLIDDDNPLRDGFLM